MIYLSRWKTILFVVIACMGIWGAIPSFVPLSVRKTWPKWIPHKAITLGLDLQGGVHLLLEIEIKEMISERYANILGVIRKGLREQKIRYKDLRQSTNGIAFSLLDEKEAPKVKELIAQQREPLTISEDNGKVKAFFNNSAIEQMAKFAVDQSIPIIRKRVDPSGTIEPLIQSQGNDRIVLQIPGFDDPQRVRQLLGKTAKLTYQWVHGMVSSPTAEDRRGDFLILPGHGKEEEGSFYKIDKEILLDGQELIRAWAGHHPENGSPIVNFEMTAKGGRIFSDLTRENKYKIFGIILDNKVLSAPKIVSHIHSGAGFIEGRFSMAEAQQLAVMMSSGALPAKLKVIEERVIGPGLGKDSIYLGSRATGIAIVVVALFMLMAYSWFGIFSVVGICFNIIFLISAMAFFGATLTLPGIAGIALTVGMAVDANVLINERIKEELRLNRKILGAVDTGYKKAMTSIVDSNATTLIGAIILYFLGTGPVQGFAVTLALGIIISMFTAIGLTRFFVMVWFQRFKPKVLRI